MVNLHMKNWHKRIFAICVFTLLASKSAFASSIGDLPFNGPMNILSTAISGPWLLAVSIIMIVITCVMLAFGEWGDGFKKIINMVMWLSVAFAATTFVTTMFAAGAVF